jgi:crotonobetainyl-CoA:carnitine CoA-transferase CaiB-like acyl-CoA transferase
VQGILLAIISRQQTGRGQHLDLALLDSAVSVLGLPAGIVAATGATPGRLGNAHPSLAPYQPYPAADGYVVVAVANERLWSKFCAAMGLDDLERDPRFATNTDRLAHRDELNARIDTRFSGQTVETILGALQRAGVPSGRIRTVTDVLDDPALAARQMLVSLQAGTRTVIVPGNPIHLSDLPPLETSPPPRVGEHTAAIRASLGRDDDQVR